MDSKATKKETAGTGNRRQQRREEEQAKRKKQRMIYIIAAAVVVLVIAVILYMNSGLFLRTATAVKIGDERYSIADYNFYYQNTYYQYYMTYYNYYGSYASNYMPDAETMRSTTLSSMRSTQALYNAAVKAGYKVTEETQKNIDDSLAQLPETAKSSGYVSVAAFLRANYGKGMTKKVYEENLVKYMTASDYATYLQENYSYTADELSAYYDLHADEYDTVSYRIFYRSGAAVTDDPDTPEDETMSADDAMALAKEVCQKVVDGTTDEASFIRLARENCTEATKSVYEDPDNFLRSSTGANLDSLFQEWVLDAGRKEGDVDILESASGCYALYFISREKNDYPTVNVRHILIKTATVNEDDYENTADYDAALQKARDEAHAKILEIKQEWKASGGTEDAFAALADEKSEDSAPGGLYEQVYDGQMVSAVNDWCFDTAHQPGDSGIVLSEEYGYHLIYFVGYDKNYCDVLADNGLRGAEYETWETKEIEQYDIDTTWVMKLRA